MKYMYSKLLSLIGIVCSTAMPTLSAMAATAILNYSPGEFRGFGAQTHGGGAFDESTGPYTFANVDGLGLNLTVSASAPVITEFIGNSSYPLAGFHMGDAATSTLRWQLNPGYTLNWVEFDFRYLSYQSSDYERLSNFYGTGGSIANASLFNAPGVTWDGSTIDPSIPDGVGTFRMEFNVEVSQFGWTYELVSGEPAGATITELRLGLVQVPEPSTVSLLGLAAGWVVVVARRKLRVTRRDSEV